MTLAQLAVRSHRATTEATSKEVPSTHTAFSKDPDIVSLSRILQELSVIERHILARAASHCWTHEGAIPYIPPTLHQTAVALALSAPSMRLLSSVPSRRGAYSFRLTRLGEAVACRVLHIVPAAEDRAREREFDRIRALMRSDFGALDQVEEEEEA